MPQADEICERVEEIVREDRISDLPDDLLLQILWFVPTKDAVLTMFLSKRWRSIWTMVLNLEYKDDDIDDVSVAVAHDDDDDDDDNDDDDNENNGEDNGEDNGEGNDNDNDNDNNNDDGDGDGDSDEKKSVWWFLDKSMQLYKAPVIQSLCIELGRRCPTDVDVGKWVAKAIDCCVRELTFNLRWSADPASLPKSLYTCKSLVELNLSHKIYVDVPCQASFPSLRILELSYVVYKDDDSLVRLLSGCPVLKVLFVKRKRGDNVEKFCVRVPSLLSLLYFCWKPDNNDVGDTSRCLVINTPRLVEFVFYHPFENYCSIENLSCLKRAVISVDTYLDDKFLRCVSLVKELGIFLNDKSIVRCSTIKFSRLKKLSIFPDDSDWLEPLLVLLGNSPKLKYLLIDYESTYKPEELPLSWKQPSSVPGCLSSQLKILEWTDYGGREEEEQFLRYILANSKCLKIATISLKPSFNLEDKEKMMKKLTNIPRVSTASQLLLKTKTMEEQKSKT